MYILLQFNKHEVLSEDQNKSGHDMKFLYIRIVHFLPVLQDVNVEMLQQATGLSPAMLSHALKPLTAGEEGILTYTISSQDPMKGEKSSLRQNEMTFFFKISASRNTIEEVF